MLPDYRNRRASYEQCMFYYYIISNINIVSYSKFSDETLKSIYTAIRIYTQTKIYSQHRHLHLKIQIAFVCSTRPHIPVLVQESITNITDQRLFAAAYHETILYFHEENAWGSPFILFFFLFKNNHTTYYGFIYWIFEFVKLHCVYVLCCGRQRTCESYMVIHSFSLCGLR